MKRDSARTSAAIMKRWLERLRRAEESDDKVAAQRVLDKMSPHQKDLLLSCPHIECQADEGAECKGTKRGIVHFPRRLTRLLLGIC